MSSDWFPPPCLCCGTRQKNPMQVLSECGSGKTWHISARRQTWNEKMHHKPIVQVPAVVIVSFHSACSVQQWLTMRVSQPIAEDASPRPITKVPCLSLLPHTQPHTPTQTFTVWLRLPFRVERGILQILGGGAQGRVGADAVLPGRQHGHSVQQGGLIIKGRPPTTPPPHTTTPPPQTSTHHYTTSTPLHMPPHTHTHTLVWFYGRSLFHTNWCVLQVLCCVV